MKKEEKEDMLKGDDDGSPQEVRGLEEVKR